MKGKINGIKKNKNKKRQKEENGAGALDVIQHRSSVSNIRGVAGRHRCWGRS